MARGKLITFEGSEGVGKSTQIKLLEKKLKREGYKVFTTREPGGTEAGERVRKIFKAMDIDSLTELFLIEASRAELVAKEILPRLSASEVVICDRYCESTLVYQGLIRKLGLSLVRRMNRIATQGLKPDFIVWMDLPSSQISERLSKRAPKSRDRFDRQKLEFHRRVLNGYKQLSRLQRSPKLRRFDASRPPAEIQEQILKELRRIL